MLELENVTGGYGGVDVLKSVTLGVDSGEMVTLLGANGAGKTTMIRAIAGVLKTSAGLIEYDGEPLRGPLHKRARRGVSIIFDDRTIIPGLTARSTLQLAHASIDEAVALFPELEPHLGRRVGLLSGGQQQMLSLARTLARKPKLLVIDELSLGLAPQVVDRLLDTLVQATRRGAAVLLVEQHIHKALAAADRCYVLKRGAILGEWPARELLERTDVLADMYVGQLEDEASA